MLRLRAAAVLLCQAGLLVSYRPLANAQAALKPAPLRRLFYGSTSLLGHGAGARDCAWCGATSITDAALGDGPHHFVAMIGGPNMSFGASRRHIAKDLYVTQEVADAIRAAALETIRGVRAVIREGPANGGGGGEEEGEKLI